MNESFGSTPATRRNERGAARLKFIIVLVAVAIIGYMAFQFLPVAYQAYTFKTHMSESAQKAADSTIPKEQKAAWAENELRTTAKDYGVPPDATITSMYQGNRIEVTVKFTRLINLLPGFTYQYDFDHTARSDSSLSAP